MLSLGLNTLGFANGWYVSQSMVVLLQAGAFSAAASIFAVHIGLGAAAFALVGRGNLGQGVGLVIGILAAVS
jgi:hypothetical protein